MLLSVFGGSLYLSSNYGSSFSNLSVPVAPYIYLPFETNPYDALGNSTVTITGSVPMVAGKVGYFAGNFANTAGAAATNYLRGAWAGSANVTVSGWFNVQTMPSSGQAVIFSAYQGQFVLSFGQVALNQLSLYMTTGGGTGALTMGTSPVLNINTWYNFVIIFQTNGLCSYYLNNSLIATYTNSQGYGSNTTSAFSLGTYDHTATNAFNGYMDDVRVYNTAITVTPIIPQNYNYSAVSATGQYMLAGVAGGSIYQSSNYGSTWTNTQGIVVSPLKAGITTSTTTTTWSQQGVTYTCSASSYYNSSTYPAQAFCGSSGYAPSWAGAGGSYASSSPYAYTGTYTTTILGGIGAVAGDWLQIQSSVPLNMQSYSWASSGLVQMPKYYYIVGSNDGTNWYPLHYAVGGSTNPFTSGATAAVTYLSVNYTGSQNIYAQVLGTYTTTAYPYSANTYTYFRLVVTNLWGYSGGNVNVGQWFINFLGANSTALIANPSTPANPMWAVANTPAILPPTTPLVAPQLTGLAANTWNQQGIAWTSSASSILSGYPAYGAFNYFASNLGWISANTVYNTTTGAYTGSSTTTILGGIGAVLGEWLQLQSSSPLTMYSYSFTSNSVNSTPKTYYIVGSNDGTNWYPVQSANMTTIGFTTYYIVAQNYILVNSTGAQPFYGNTLGSVTTTSYGTSSAAYTYFRIITTTVWATNAGYVDIGSWSVNFIPPSVNTLLVSPQQTSLATNTWTQGSISYTATASTTNSASYPIYGAFNNYYGSSQPYSWASGSNTYNASTGAYTGAVSTTILGGVGAVSGEWLQLQTSVPLSIYSYTFACGGSASTTAKTYYIVGSNDGTNWYPLQYAVISVNPFTTANTTCTTSILITSSGAQSIVAGTTGTITTTTYSYASSSYSYFRLVTVNTFGAYANVEIGEWYIYFAQPTVTPGALTLSGAGSTAITLGTVPITPQQTGLAVLSWSTQGITWNASASTIYSGLFPVYNIFNVISTNIATFWSSANNTYSSGLPIGGTTATTIIQGGIGTVAGEWVQIQSSVPLVMNSYSFANAGVATIFKNYYIVGSNDGTNWFPLQFAAMATNPFNGIYTTCTNYLSMNVTGTQTLFGNVAANITTTSYPYTNNAYTYFRMIITVTWGGVPRVEFCQWFINFLGGQTYSTTASSSSTTWNTNTSIASANALALSGNGLYALAAISTTGQLNTNYLNTPSSTTLTLTGITGAITGTAVSLSGQYMILVTSGTSNNVYYSTNYGSTWTSITVGSTGLSGCSISNDGTYLTAVSATTVYILNINSTGNTVSIGNNAGLTNQGANAIAIGNNAGVTNQSANSIVLNASGTAFNTTGSGLYAAPIATYTASVASSFGLLCYGTDNQIVQYGSVTQAGLVGVKSAEMAMITFGTTFTVGGTTGNFNFPLGIKTLYIRMIGGGGAGGRDSAVGGAGGNTTWTNSASVGFTCGGGGGGGWASTYTYNNGGTAPGIGLSGTGYCMVSVPGSGGDFMHPNLASVYWGGQGAGSFLSGPTMAYDWSYSHNGQNALPNTGAGGSGCNGYSGVSFSGCGGGSGGYAELLYQNISLTTVTTFNYSIGAGGTCSTGSYSTGGSGGSGVIIVMGFY
jgi:hypothetical protein